MGATRKKDLLARDLSEQLEGAEPAEIIKAAFDNFAPVAVFSGYSGGDDSLVATDWSMKNIKGCKVFHANTGIGVEAARVHVRNMCKKNCWDLTEIRAKEDCGQDYDKFVVQHGFPGPAMHGRMFQRLKERAVWELLKRNKTHRSDNVMLITGIRKDESQRRSGYKYSLFDFTGNMLWVNPFYYKPKSWFMEYILQNNLDRSPVSKVLGMSGECLCGAFAHKGEKDLIKIVCPETHARIEALEFKVRAAGHNWGWEDSPPKKTNSKQKDMFMPLCMGCEK